MTSPALEEFIESEEWKGTEDRLPDGRFRAAWDAIGGCWTIGPGLTQGITRSTVMTKEQIDQAYAKELVPFEEGVRRAVKVRVTNNQFSALVSFAYNVGLRGFLKSSLLRLLNAGQMDQVPVQLKLWVHGRATGSRKITGLVNRRNAEIALWRTPDNPSSLTAAMRTIDGVPSVQVQAYVPHYDPAFPVPKGAVTLETAMSSAGSTVNVPLSATTAIISQLGHKVVTATQGTLLAFVTYILTHFSSVWDLLGINASTVSVYTAIAIIAAIEWYKHTWVTNSNDTTAAIIDSLEIELQKLAGK
jgi:lysozyme